MTQRFFSSKMLGLVLLAGAAAFGAKDQALAGELSARQIVDSLKAPRTRSLSVEERPSLSADELTNLTRIRRTRSLSSGDRAQMAEIAGKRPGVDLQIYFDFDSAELSAKAEPQLNNLGQALTSPELAGSVIMLGGHTDAKGSDRYNQSLSERRAETIKRFLIERYKISPENLVAVGYGESRLKNKADPDAAENRRVEIVNAAAKEQAAR
ncbi:OmpA/MotB [Nitrobacter sp. Nb-311A]|nr:OmpA family protein [Nitrobacter sp.]EAQ36014.1 OmpA/MotB [Nitrobacter sp. Nb-311A]MCB1393345.1 OmpA family protein [Nitrobacter sp.]MCV0385831.1 OmpA family protein [Nitrobacter sp.]